MDILVPVVDEAVKTSILSFWASAARPGIHFQCVALLPAERPFPPQTWMLLRHLVVHPDNLFRDVNGTVMR